MGNLGLGAAAGGGMAYKLLQDMLVRRFTEEQAGLKQQNELARQGIDQGRLANDTAQVGIQRDDLAERRREHTTTEDRLNRQWADDAPIRISTAANQNANAAHNTWEMSPEKQVADEKNALERIHATGNEGVREANARAAAAANAKTGKKIWVVRPDDHGINQRIMIDEKDYLPGDQPGDTRSMGQHVTTGDASRIAEIDYGLNEAKKLSETLTPPGATGVQAALESAMPNMIATPLGIGAASKGRQAQIMLVKQLIGKGLEGGVLRAEDEPKYRAMLPAIDDQESVVKEKLANLTAALQDKRESHLNTLEQAGYDVTKFRQHQNADQPKGGDSKSRQAKWGY